MRNSDQMTIRSKWRPRKVENDSVCFPIQADVNRMNKIDGLTSYQTAILQREMISRKSSKLKDRVTGFNPRSNPTLIRNKGVSVYVDGWNSKGFMLLSLSRKNYFFDHLNWNLSGKLLRILLFFYEKLEYLIQVMLQHRVRLSVIQPLMESLRIQDIM